MEIANKTTRNNVKNIHDVEMMVKFILFTLNFIFIYNNNN